MRLPWVSRARHEAMRVGFATALGDAYAQHIATKADLAIAEDALEAERQWRLTSLPALLAAEARAVKAEALLERALSVGEDLLEDANLLRFPELRQTKRHAALINAYHESKERP